LKDDRGKWEYRGEKEIDSERGNQFDERYNGEMYACMIGDSGTLAMTLHGSKISYLRIIETAQYLAWYNLLLTVSDGDNLGPRTACAIIFTDISHSMILFS
jgi:hypothetical protein